MRAIESFDNRHRPFRARTLRWAATLVAWALCCVVLTLNNYNVRAVFTALALVLGIKLLLALKDYLSVVMQQVRAYHDYLNTCSYRAMLGALNDPQLSPWSKTEIKQYLVKSQVLPSW